MSKRNSKEEARSSRHRGEKDGGGLGRRDFLKTMGLGAAAFTLPLIGRSGCGSSGGPAERPNVVFILSDDQGYAQLKSFSDTCSLDRFPPERLAVARERWPVEACIEAANRAMPNTDRLISEGMRFLDAHTAPTCGPSRACLMTGRYPQRYGCYTNKDFPLPADAFCLTELLQKEGYNTALVGKWHLGSEKGQHPLDSGFDYYFGFDNWGTKKYGAKDLQRNRKPAEAEGFLTDQLSSEAVQFIERNAGKDDPFLLYLSYNNPHEPRPTPPEHYLEPFDTGDGYVDEFYAYLRSMDVGVGRVLRALGEAGQAENTIVIFASDNGGYMGEFAGTPSPFPANGLLKGGKRNQYEGGQRVCMGVRWPGHIPAGSTSRDYVHFMDIMPTLLAAAGIEIPKGHDLDGRNVLPAFLGERSGMMEREPHFWAAQNLPVSEEFFQEWRTWLDGDRSESPWAFWYLPAGYSVRQGRWKMINPGTGTLELYDLQKDIAETTDLAERHPEKLRELLDKYRQWFKQMPEPRGWDKNKWRGLFPPEEV